MLKGRRLKALRLVLLAIAVAFIILGLGQYGFLRALVRFLCPSCAGLA